jgi:hypothetical protein
MQTVNSNGSLMRFAEFMETLPINEEADQLSDTDISNLVHELW